jgi:membrane-associated protease RseP (regulator of RpoE activity)
MKRTFFSFAGLLLLVLPAWADQKQATPVSVPFELLKTKHIAVKIMVNGKGPYRVIFDTGSPVILLNNKIAKESGVLDKNAKQPLFSLFGAAGESKIKTLEIGSLKAANLPAVVMDHPALDVVSKFLGPIEGIVGFPFFARYKMSLDYQTQRLTFVPNGYDPPDVMKAIMDTIMAMAGDKPKPPKVLAPAGQWGVLLKKDDKDLDEGITIQEVLPGSAAAQAGLQAGDRLLTLDGRWTDSLADAYQAAAHIKPGTRALIMIRRASQQMELTVTPQSGS